MGDDRPNVYMEDDGTVIYRASAMGNCIRSLVASRMGIEPMPHPDWLLEKFDQGNLNEPIILKMLENKGWFIYPDGENGQMEVEIPVGTGVKIRGHLDGVGFLNVETATTPGDWGPIKVDHVVEAKAFGMDSYDRYMKQGIHAFPYYVDQATIYMTAMGMPMVFVVGVKDADGVVDRIGITRFIETPGNIGRIKAKVAKVEALAKKGELPPCDYQQYPCQYYLLHEDTEADRVAEVGEDLEVDLLLTNYVRGQELERQAKELKGPAGEQLKKIMEQRAVIEIDRLKHKISTVSRANTKVDTVGLMEKFGREEVNAFIEVTKTQSIRVTEKKQEGEGE